METDKACLRRLIHPLCLLTCTRIITGNTNNVYPPLELLLITSDRFVVRTKCCKSLFELRCFGTAAKPGDPRHPAPCHSRTALRPVPHALCHPNRKPTHRPKTDSTLTQPPPRSFAPKVTLPNTAKILDAPKVRKKHPKPNRTF